MINVYFFNFIYIFILLLKIKIQWAAGVWAAAGFAGAAAGFGV